MKHLFIVNPTAGGKDRTAEVREQAQAAFADFEGKYEIYVTKAPMDATEKIKAAAASGEQLRVYSCGGDGTFNECVCGAAGLDNVAVCPFPIGTGNDFCRLFGKEKELFRDLPALLRGTEHPIDLIDCNGRYCANICSVGLDARVAETAHRYSRLPIIGGATCYVIALIATMFQGISRKMRVICGDYDKSSSHTLVCACNGNYYGGGFHPTLTARPDDGLLDFFIIDGVNLPVLITLIGKYAKGCANKVKRYITSITGTEVNIEFDEPSPINIDGETVYSDKICMKVVHDAVKFIVPEGMRYFAENKEKLLQRA